MVPRARLVAPRYEPADWRWHKAKTASLPASLFLSGDRRMEAETYLTSGFGIKAALEIKTSGWKTFESLATVRQPNRLKGIVVSEKYGIPYLGATQVFDNRPVSRRWLALERTATASDLYLKRGMVVLTRSGAVGRALAVSSYLEDFVVSDDLLRVTPVTEEWWGWIYAYLRAPQVRQMMSSAKYGHIIKHLEPSHINDLPVPLVSKRWRKYFSELLEKVLILRERSFKLSKIAEKLFEESVGDVRITDRGETGFVCKASVLSKGRRRLDAWPNNPEIRKIDSHLRRNSLKQESLREAGFDVWLPTRFKRIAATEGVPLVGSAELFEVNPDINKRIADGDFGDRHKARVKAGWILLSRSGQIYGINGSMVLATKAHEDKVISDHVIRIAPNKAISVRPGYVFIALTHPTLGRVRVKGLAYGSSIPEIEVADVENIMLPRLSKAVEAKIADAAEQASQLQAEAELLERHLAQKADSLIDQFVADDLVDFDIR